MSMQCGETLAVLRTFGLVCAVITALPTHAQLTFTRLIGTGEPLPGGGENIGSLTSPVLDDARPDGRALLNLQTGTDYGAFLFVPDQEPVLVMANTTPAPGGGRFDAPPTAFAMYDGTSYLIATPSESTNGLYRLDTPGGAATAVVRAGDLLPGETATFGNVYSVSVGADGVAFEATVYLSPAFYYQGVFHAVGSEISQIMGIDTVIPDGGNTTFGETQAAWPVISDGEILFRSGGGFPDLKSGVYTLPIPGSAKQGGVVADLATPVPEGTNNFTFPAFIWAGDHDRGNSVFYATSPGNVYAGVYARIDGVLHKIADNETPLPEGTGTFTFPPLGGSIRVSMAISGRRIVLQGHHADFRSGIYLWEEGRLTKLAGPGDVLGTATVYRTFFARDGFTGSRLAFWIQQAEGGSSAWLLELASANPERPSLSIHIAGATVFLEWEASGAVLQYTDSLVQPAWSDLPSAVSPYAVDLEARPARFYRLAVNH